MIQISSKEDSPLHFNSFLVDMHTRLRALTPFPQVTEHGPHTPQSLNLAEDNYKNIFHLKRFDFSTDVDKL